MTSGENEPEESHYAKYKSSFGQRMKLWRRKQKEEKRRRAPRVPIKRRYWTVFPPLSPPRTRSKTVRTVSESAKMQHFELKIFNAPKDSKALQVSMDNERLQSHLPATLNDGDDGGSVTVGQWVAVAYSKRFYIGKVTEIEIRALDMKDEVEVTIDFLARNRDGTYRWPFRKDVALVSEKYIFCTKPKLHTIDTDFLLENKQFVEGEYNKYKKAYNLY